MFYSLVIDSLFLILVHKVLRLGTFLIGRGCKTCYLIHVCGPRNLLKMYSEYNTAFFTRVEPSEPTSPLFSIVNIIKRTENFHKKYLIE